MVTMDFRLDMDDEQFAMLVESARERGMTPEAFMAAGISIGIETAGGPEGIYVQALGLIA